MSIHRGRWHGAERYFGLHYDLHAGAQDTVLGARCSLEELVPSLQAMDPDFVQTDCKGHPGYTSWFSEVPEASVSPGVVQDAMRQWRDATRSLGLPLHCHYSGIWDQAAGAKHPEWCAVGSDGQPVAGKMCPRSPYVDQLLIPQLIELIDRYEVDGFWIDGDLWAVEPCYCAACLAAWRAESGLAEAPTATDDPHWPRWWEFMLASFEAYVTHYAEAVHAHKSGVLVCSNWLQTFRHPGEPRVPTDWISGDNAWVWGLDGSRCEARFLSTRGKPWDIMLWAFYCSHGMGQPDSPWTAKPPEMLMQEAAVLLSFGGNVQIYEHPQGLRDGRLVPWRQARWGEVSRFVKERRAVCQGGESWPQVAVLHSERHVRSGASGKNLMHGFDISPVHGAVFALLEDHLGVDILDEWALLPRLGEFPVVVVPEQDRMADAMVAGLKAYAEEGGKLLVTGAGLFDRFGGPWLGAESESVDEGATWHVPAGDGTVPLHSAAWRRLKPTTAQSLGELGRTPLADDELLGAPAAVLRQVGRGEVAFIPAAVCHDFAHNRYPGTRQFLSAVVRKLAGELEVEVTAPTAIDVALRRQGGRRVIHFVNRLGGLPNLPNNGVIDEIPPLGPVSVKVRTAEPSKVWLAFGEPQPAWRWDAGVLTVSIPSVRIHSALVIEG